MARDLPAGRAFIELFLKGDNLSSDMRRMRRRLGRITTVLGGVAAAFTAVGVAAGTVAVAGIIKAVNAAGDFAETVSKFETVFGDRANVVRDWADSAAEALGITRQAALQTLASFQDLFVPLGLDASAAEEMSKQLTTLAVDLASFNNLRSEDVVRDLQAAMTGSSETMKKYGVIVDMAAVKQELLNQKLDPKTASNAEKAFARLQIILRSTLAAQGDAERTAESFNNLKKRLATTWEEMKIDVGQKFLPVFRDLAQVALLGLKDLQRAIDNNLPDFSGLDEGILRAAKSGNWEAAGNLIGLQILKGVRNTVGPRLFDFINMTLQSSGFGAGGRGIVNEIGRELDMVQNVLGIAGGGTMSSEKRSQAIEDAIKLQNELIKAQLKETKETNKLLEEQTGPRMQ